MGLRTILIITGLALASTFGVAQRVSSTPTTGGAAAGNGTNVGTGTNVNSPAATTSVPPPGVTSVPIGINAIGSGSGTAQITNVPTAVIVPTTGFNGPSQTFPLVTTPTVTFVNSADGTSTVPVLNYGGGASPVAGNAGAAANNGNNSTANQTADLNLGNVSSVSELYGGDNRGVAEVSRQYKARRNGVQNARVYTNADIDRIRAQAGEGRSATPANDQQATMPASDQSAEQSNQATTPQVQPPAANQKPSPFTPKQ